MASISHEDMINIRVAEADRPQVQDQPDQPAWQDLPQKTNVNIFN